MATVDVNMAAGCIRYYGGWADKIEGKVIETNSETFNYTKQEPVCVIPSKLLLIDPLTDFLDRCLRSNHPMEFPPPHVGMEDRPCHGMWELCGSQVRRADPSVRSLHG